MKTIIVDDEARTTDELTKVCKEVGDIEVLGCFQNPVDALGFAEKNRVDMAILDIEMPGMNGLELGEKLKLFYHDVILLYVTGHTKYVLDTIKIKADYFVMKPYTKEDVEGVLERAKLLAKRQRKMVQLRMFGRFQVFADHHSVFFRNAKAKELFALCMDHRGSAVTMEEAAYKLWPEKPYDEKVKRLYRKAVCSLQDTLEEYEITHVFESNRGECHGLMECVSGDFPSVGAGEKNEYVYQEPYLQEYPWAGGDF